MHASRHRVVCETRTPPGHRCSTLPRLCTPEGSRSARVAVSSPVSGWTCTQETVSERVARARQRSNLAWQWNWKRSAHPTRQPWYVPAGATRILLRLNRSTLWPPNPHSDRGNCLLTTSWIGVGKGSRPPRPPNRAGGSPAHGSPVGGCLIGIGAPQRGLRAR